MSLGKLTLAVFLFLVILAFAHENEKLVSHITDDLDEIEDSLKHLESRHPGVTKTSPKVSKKTTPKFQPNPQKPQKRRHFYKQPEFITRYYQTWRKAKPAPKSKPKSRIVKKRRVAAPKRKSRSAPKKRHVSAPKRKAAKKHVSTPKRVEAPKKQEPAPQPKPEKPKKVHVPPPPKPQPKKKKGGLFGRLKKAGKGLFGKLKAKLTKKAPTPAPSAPAPKKKGFFSRLKEAGKKLVSKVSDVKNSAKKSIVDEFKGIAADLNAAGNTKLAIDGATDADFSPSPVSQHKFEKLKQLVALAFATYCEPDHVSKFECYHCKKFTGKLLKLKRIQDSQDFNAAILGETPYYNFMIFRGSRTRTNTPKNIMVGLHNWVTNLDARKVHLPGYHKGVKVHSGMLDAYKSLKAQAFDYISRLPKHKPLYIGGHSRGGAIATIAALDAKKMGYNVELLTLGSPRVANKAFVVEFTAALKDHSYRVVNKGDFLTHAPIVKQGFYHVPNEVWVDWDNKEHFCRFAKGKVWAQDPRCSAGVPMSKYEAQDHSDYLGFSARTGQLNYC